MARHDHVMAEETPCCKPVEHVQWLGMQTCYIFAVYFVGHTQKTGNEIKIFNEMRMSYAKFDR